MVQRQDYWGEREQKFVYLFICVYIYMVRAYSVYAFCPICA